MTHLTRYGRRLKMTLIAGMSAACFACIFAIPFAENKFNNKVDITALYLTVRRLAVPTQDRKLSRQWQQPDSSSVRNMILLYIWITILIL